MPTAARAHERPPAVAEDTAKCDLWYAARILRCAPCRLGRGRQTKIRELEERLHDETELLETRQAELEQLEVIRHCMCANCLD